MRSQDEVVLRYSAEATTVDEGLSWLVQKMDQCEFSPDSLQFTMYAVNYFINDEGDEGHWETFYQCGIAGTVSSADVKVANSE
jgi:hypothetical protein